MKRTVVFFLMLGTLQIAGGRGQNAADDTVAAPAAGEQDVEFVCHFFYRTSTRTGDDQKEQLTITIPFLEGDIPSIPLGIRETVEFENLSCVATGNYNSLALHFYETATTESITSLLFQFADVPDNRLTSHGLTGLHYVYHPESEAELQFWATVNEADSAAEPGENGPS